MTEERVFVGKNQEEVAKEFARLIKDTYQRSLLCLMEMYVDEYEEYAKYNEMLQSPHTRESKTLCTIRIPMIGTFIKCMDHLKASILLRFRRTEGSFSIWTTIMKHGNSWRPTWCMWLINGEKQSQNSTTLHPKWASCYEDEKNPGGTKNHRVFFCFYWKLKQYMINSIWYYKLGGLLWMR